jgi:tetratricopeptide (TPR) repeat protein
MGEKKRKLAAQASTPAVMADAPASGLVAAPAMACLQRGRQALAGGQFLDALNACQQALKLAPDLVEALHYQGLALLQLGQGALGISLLRQSLERQPDNALFHYNLGNALLGVDAAASLPHLARAAALDPNDLPFALAHATLLRTHGSTQDAIAAWRHAQALDPARSETLRTLAEIYYLDNQLAAARTCFAQALALNPQLAKNSRIGFAAPAPARTEPSTALQLSDFAESVFTDEPALRDFAAACDLHILDNFLNDPVAYREQALALPFHALRYAGQNYPGVQTDGYDCQDIMDRIATALGRRIKFISPDNGSYRISLAGSAARTDIHADNESGDNFNYYAAVLYLNPPSQCQGGTTFWRHVPTGWARRPVDAEVRAAGYASFRTFQKQWLPPHGPATAFDHLEARRPGWQAVLQVPMRNNRLILYRGDYFHAIGEVFGESHDDGRLVQLFFFEVVDEH